MLCPIPAVLLGHRIRGLKVDAACQAPGQRSEKSARLEHFAVTNCGNPEGFWGSDGILELGSFLDYGSQINLPQTLG